MAISRIKYGGVRGKALNYSEFLCDGTEDLENLPTNIKKTDDFPTCAIGSRAFIGDITYMLFPSGEWKQSKLVVCDCGCIHGNGSESEEDTNTESTSEDLDAALSTIAAIIDGSITEIEDTKVTGTIHTALMECDSLTSISFANATAVGDAAFGGCIELTNVSLPNVISIGNDAFSGCSSLTEISLPNATSIGTAAFGECTGLTNVSLPNVTSIGAHAFGGCSSLTEISLPNVTSICANIFSRIFGGAAEVNQSITTIKLPSATTIEQDAFLGCAALTDLYLPGAEASYTNAPFGLNTETCTIHYEYDFSADEQEQQDNG